MEDEEERQVFALITRTLERSRREENVKEVGGLREYLRNLWKRRPGSATFHREAGHGITGRRIPSCRAAPHKTNAASQAIAKEGS